MATFVRAQGGEDAWHRVLARLSPEDRSVVEGMVAVGWYDLALQHRLLRAVDAALGHGDLALIPAVARFEADQDLTRIHRMFLRLANPAFVLEKSGEYWHRFYDTGEWSVKRERSNHAVATLTGVGEVDVAFCMYLSRYIERMFELVGAKEVHVDHPRCRTRGEPACVFAGAWRER